MADINKTSDENKRIILRSLSLNLTVFYASHSAWIGTHYHYENMPIQIYRKSLTPKNENFQIKNADIFLISAQNIECGYSLEPPRQTASARRF